MASLRKLRRRLLRWERYVRHYRLLTTAASDPWPHLPEGYWRATHAYGRARRQQARLWRMQRKDRRKVERHANDRFWQARNRPAFDDEGPF